MPKHTALITGASSGIGVEFARIHAQKGGDLVLVARREDRLRKLAAELEKHGAHVTVIAKDLSREHAAEEICQELQARGLQIDVLINNAGFGGHGLFHQRDWRQDDAMLHVNVLALTGLSRLLLPGMVERGHGRILNVASTAAFLPGPLQAVYYATKAYVVSFSEAIANELAGTGVTVTALCPGATASEFAEQAGVGDTPAFRSTATAREVADFGYAAMLAGTPVAVHGLGQKLLFHAVLRALPRGVITRLSRSFMEKPKPG